VLTTGRSTQKICEAEIANRDWASRHWRSIQSQYSRTPHFRALAPILSRLYETASAETLLSRINELFIRRICDLLEIDTKLSRSSDYQVRGDRIDRLIGILQQAGSTVYLGGPRGKAYIDEQRFRDAGISLYWMDYSAFPVYAQLYSPPFVHKVTILDLLLNEGIEGARSYMQTAISLCEATIFDPTFPARDSETPLLKIPTRAQLI
jgi:hypothetical protein